MISLRRFQQLVLISALGLAFALSAAALMITASYLSKPAQAAGIFTLKGKLKSINDDIFVIQTRTMVYDIRKSGLIKEQIEEMKTKKVGQDIDLVVSTEAVARARDL